MIDSNQMRGGQKKLADDLTANKLILLGASNMLAGTVNYTSTGESSVRGGVSYAAIHSSGI